MNKQQYRQARALIRANGMFALRWMRMSHASIMLVLANQKADPLAWKLEDARIMQKAAAYGF